MKKGSKSEERGIAKARIEKLLEMAEDEATKGGLEEAKKLVEQAWRIKLKFQLRLKREQKKLFCRKCRTFFVEGKTSRSRTENGWLKTTCLECGAVQRLRLGGAEREGKNSPSGSR